MKIEKAFGIIRNGASIKQLAGAGGVPITRIETIADRSVDRDKMGYANIDDIGKYKSYVLQDGDILMSHINSVQHLGKTAIYHALPGEKIIHGMNLLGLRANREVMNPEYANYFFNSYVFLLQLPRITKKSVNQASFTVTELKQLNIPCPSLERQQQIVDTLAKVDKIIGFRKTQLLKLDELVKSRFIEMFGDPKQNPRNWKVMPLSNVILYANNGLVRRGNDKNGSIVLRLVELQDGYIDYSNPNRIIINEKERKKYLLRNNDFLFARVNGNPENVGRCAIFYDIGEEVYHNDHIIRVHFDEHVLDGTFASTLLNSKYGKQQLNSQIKTSAGQYTVSQNGIGSILTILPPLKLQMEFAEFAKQIGKSKISIQKSLDELETLKKSLMQQYFG